MENKEKRLVTAALPYVNNVPHLGNIVGSHLPADIFARYCRLKGFQTLFIGGTDDHGTPIEVTAEKEKRTPQELCDYFYKIHKEIYDWFKFSYDNFSRTSKPIHYQTTKDFFKKVYEKGWIFERKLKLPYCIFCQRFLPDRYIEGVCPYCGYKRARGDQCEKCGRILDPRELKNPYCVICRLKNIEQREVKHLFLDLKRLAPKLEKWIRASKNWRKQVRQEALGWIKEGLRPRAITRNLKWGIPVPLKGYTEKVFYVWFEAPIGYISSTKERLPRGWKEYWQSSQTKIYHFVGKDNVPFHTIFWPASLMAHGGFNLPYNIVGLQYLNYEGSKFSKSRGWGVFCENLPKIELDVDYWRFYLSFLIPETRDTDFKWRDFQEKINSDLIGNLSNFIHRTLSIIDKYLAGQIQKPDFSDLSSLDKKFVSSLKKNSAEIDKLIDKVELREGLKKILFLSSEGNRYFNHKAPWKLIREKNKIEAERTLGLCLNLCRTLAILIAPYLPDASQRVWRQLGLKGNVLDKGVWETAGEIIIKGTHRIGKPEILFQKLNSKSIEELKTATSKV